MPALPPTWLFVWLLLSLLLPASMLLPSVPCVLLLLLFPVLLLLPLLAMPPLVLPTSTAGWVGRLARGGVSGME